MSSPKVPSPRVSAAAADDTNESTSTTFPFVEMEHRILALWERERIFAKSLDATKDKKPYVFYDGPPFATGLPHHGHIVASLLKDVVPRYWTMKGRYVLRRFGWDCHGLPIEHEIDKQLGFSAADAVAQLGIAGYNNECRKIVSTYVAEWRHTITRLGRWVDFDHDYKTMDPWFMESVWWVLKQLWDKGLVYQGVKVMPISTELGTVLSNFEAGQNYQDVQDPSITVLFKLEDENAYVAAWTTTPWTLPSNLAMCVNADLDYVKAHDAERNVDIYLAKDRLAEYQKHHKLEMRSELKGAALAGRRYVPLFPYFAHLRDKGAFVVLTDAYVTTDSGTGIVHQAPAFGEDDYRIAKAAGIEAFVVPVTLNGRFTDEVPDYAGQYVKDADKHIIRALKDSGALYEQATIVHSYPFCYRSDTPLIYRAIPSWYVRVSSMVDGLLKANEQVRWVPDHIKHGRFGNWLANAMDWSISRNRVWGTPLPIWENDVTGARMCIGSIDELEQLTGVRPNDLHREFVDPLTFTRPGEAGVYRRVAEVLDCWFESGSMPYAQLHYPFENEALFKAGFPAEFIAEGLDQTRGWFYTLIVLSTALYQKPAFRNVIVNGMVMAEDGKKMSKRLRNYTPPDELMEIYGADALRLYLMNSGLMRAEEQRFADVGLKDMTRRALLPWINAFQFLKTYASIDGWAPESVPHHGDNVLDRWILSKLQTLKSAIGREMNEYKLFNVVPRLFEFIEDLTNWYIRLNRPRFWAEDITADKISAYSTLYTAVEEISLVMAPFAPFLSEHLYQELSRLAGEATPQPASVHLCDYPVPEEHLMQPRLEEAVSLMQDVVLLGRRRREEAKVNLRTPLRLLTVIHRDAALLDELRTLEEYLKRELNVKRVEYTQDEERYIRLYAKPNFPVLGKRLGKRMKSFQARIQAMDRDEILGLQTDGKVTLDDETFTTDEVEVLREAQPGTNTLSDSFISIDLDATVDEELEEEGTAREFLNRLQRLRKDRDLPVTQRIDVVYDADDKIRAAVERHKEQTASAALCISIEFGDPGSDATQLTIDGKPLRVRIEPAK